jgi:hypothetical protein
VETNPPAKPSWQNVASVVIEIVLALMLVLALIDEWAGLMPERFRTLFLFFVLGFYAGEKFATWKSRTWRSN